MDSQASFIPESPPMSQSESDSQVELVTKLTNKTESPGSVNPSNSVHHKSPPLVENYDIIDDDSRSSSHQEKNVDNVEEEEDDQFVIEDEDDTDFEDDDAEKNNQKTSSDCVIDMDIDIEEVEENECTAIPSTTTATSPQNPTTTKTTAPGHPSLDSFFDDDDDDSQFLRGVEQLEQSFGAAAPAAASTSSNNKNNDGGESLSDPSGMGDIIYRTEQERLEEVKEMKRLDPSERIFPDVKASSFHTVTFFLSPDYRPGDELQPHPSTFQSKWDNEFVPLPCATQNTRLYKVRIQTDNQNNGGDRDDRVRYREERVWMWSRIQGVLTSFQILSCSDFALALKQYFPFKTELKALNYCIESIMSGVDRYNFFDKTLPFMQRLCLDLEQSVTCPLPLLKKFKNHSISLSQKQIAVLLANAFFSTFPKRFGDDEDQYPSINFIELFQAQDDDVTKAQKIRCVINYFERVADNMPNGVVTFTRKSIRHAAAPNWETLTRKVTKIVPLLHGTIEDDGAGMLQVDFANKFLGGGFLGRGAVQEEILFAIYPELILSRLFTEKLTSCEALVVTGCERFSRYSGYASSFAYEGDFIDVTSLDPKGRRCCQFVAVDALYITRPVTQFHPRFLTRELNKAYVGFSSPTGTSIPVATGKWGCGAFNGNPQLKAVLQLLAASQAGRDVVFFAFGDIGLQQEIEEMYETIKNCSIQQVWQLLCHYYTLFCTTPKAKYTLFEYIARFANGEDDATTNSTASSTAQKSISSYFSPVSSSKNKNSSTSSSSAIGGNSASSSSYWSGLGAGNKLKEIPIASFYSRDDDDFQKSATTPMDEEISFQPSTSSSDRALNGSPSELKFIQKPKIAKITPFLKNTTTTKPLTSPNSSSEGKKKFAKNEVLTDSQITDFLLLENSQQEEPEKDEDVVLLQKNDTAPTTAKSPHGNFYKSPPPSSKRSNNGEKQTSLTDFDFYKQN